jgi:L-ascorbate metabolism protein UlaG (beta-lactamase superfamily)
MKVQWYGHACFLIEGQGIRLVTDPPNPDVGYSLPQAAIDVVTVSHAHHDHNYVEGLQGNPVVVKTPGRRQVKGLQVEGYSTWHDNAGGAQRGPNLIFAWEMDGVRAAHLGDLGHLLGTETLQALGRIDLLLAPVGGVFTVDAAGAKQVVDQIQPRLVVPMHYRTPALSFKLGAVDDFLRLFPPGQVRREQALEIDRRGLPDSLEVVVLDYVGQQSGVGSH